VLGFQEMSFLVSLGRVVFSIGRALLALPLRSESVWFADVTCSAKIVVLLAFRGSRCHVIAPCALLWTRLRHHFKCDNALFFGTEVHRIMSGTALWITKLCLGLLSFLRFDCPSKHSRF
jgi:hypothetical protein